MIGEAVRDQLVATTAVTDVVSTRIYPTIIPQRGEYPACTYNLDFDERVRLMNGTEGDYRRATVEVNCYATRLSVAHDIADAVESALIDFRGTLGTTSPVSIDCDHIRLERRGPEIFEAETELHRVPLQFLIGYERV